MKARVPGWYVHVCRAEHVGCVLLDLGEGHFENQGRS